ncbi:uncharacterized protein L203_104629 [Cryptococcus depauperatus CBS 7841]|uniref:PSI domain-containing protein n=1 Tax=Cryptococcus depauperatus CBS 7841 TaxID=1295531 RepID=A0AAJ8JVT1_9TREE
MIRLKAFKSHVYIITILLLLSLSLAQDFIPAQPPYATKFRETNRRVMLWSNRADNGVESSTYPPGDSVCKPFGECSPCPKDELDQAYCIPFGNRRLLHCIPANTTHSSTVEQGEIPAWEACGKVIKKERQDFYEFVTANIFFLIFALAILWARTSALAAKQYKQLAARIGIPGGGWGRPV